MARIQIIEPVDEIAQLIKHVGAGLGHEAAFGSDGRADEIDVLVVEPGAPESLAAAKALRAESPDLPIVIVSIYPKSPETMALRPAAYIVKPFRLGELEQALAAAIAPSPRLVPVTSA
jgi:DNA-binding NarL/FixJ family response regulator